MSTNIFEQFIRRKGPDGLPIPSAGLRFAVAGTTDLKWFFEGGRLGKEAICDILEKNKISLGGMQAVLDFGCGIGRVLRHFSSEKGPGYFGTDYNPSLINWCTRNLKFARFNVNQLEGRLIYEDNQFDLVYVLSVFTHLTEEQGFFWIKELTRITRPGGYLYITTHGKDFYWKDILEPDRQRFLNGELIVYGSDRAGTNICATFHPESYIRKVLAKDLVVVDFIKQGARGNPMQDAWLLQKPLS